MGYLLFILRLHPTPMSPRPPTRPRPCRQLGATLTLPLLANFFLSNPPPFIPSMSIYFLFNSSLSNSVAILLSALAKVVAGSPTPGPTCAGSGQLYGAGQMPHLIPPQEVQPSPRASHSWRGKRRASGRPDLAELLTQRSK